MTRAGEIKIARKFFPDLIDPEKIKPMEVPCPVCDKPMRVSVGQVIGSHKECRKEFKRMSREQEKYNITYDKDVEITNGEKER